MIAATNKKYFQKLLTQLVVISRLIAIVSGAVLASIIPQRYDKTIIQWAHRLVLRILTSRTEQFSNKFQALLSRPGQALDADKARQLASNNIRMYLEIYWGRVASISLRRKTYPNFELMGTKNLVAALSLGKGAILWRMSFTCATPVNAALLSCGHPLVHLSLSDHMSPSNGRTSRLIGKLLTHDEARFLNERVTMDRNRVTGYFPTLMRALAANHVVSIVGDTKTGRVRTKVAVGKAFLEVPSGAPSLAFSTGAALLPCTAVRIAPFRYRVIIYPNVAPHHVPGLTKKAFRDAATQRFISLRNNTMEKYADSDTLGEYTN